MVQIVPRRGLSMHHHNKHRATLLNDSHMIMKDLTTNRTNITSEVDFNWNPVIDSNFLRTAPFFKDFAHQHGTSEENLNEVASCCTPQIHAEGVMLIQEEEMNGSWFVVLEGEVRRTKDGEEVDTIGAGNFFGMRSAIIGMASPATVVTTMPTKLLAIDGMRTRDLFKHMPNLEKLMKKTVEDRQHKENKAVEKARRKIADKAHKLTEYFIKEFGRKKSGATKKREMEANNLQEMQLDTTEKIHAEVEALSETVNRVDEQMAQVSSDIETIKHLLTRKTQIFG